MRLHKPLCTATAEDKPAIMRAVDVIPGWTRTGDVETCTKDGLYGYIDGGAEIVLEYGFRELAVFKFKPAVPPAALKEVVLEIRTSSGETVWRCSRRSARFGSVLI
jgi:hypothetical protein